MPTGMIVVAHPDDEILGAGGAASYLTSLGFPIYCAIMSGGVTERRGRPGSRELAQQRRAAQTKVGIVEAAVGSFPNIRFNCVPHIELVQFIEGVIEELNPSIVFTHHPADINDDHRHTSLACQAAVRLFQRQSGVIPLKSLMYMEVPSSTDWSFDHGAAFRPTTFLEIGEEHLAHKLAALREYQGVMRPYPHPRSEEVIRGWASVRGAQAGMRYAEAFETVFQDLSIVFSHSIGHQ